MYCTTVPNLSSLTWCASLLELEDMSIPPPHQSSHRPSRDGFCDCKRPKLQAASLEDEDQEPRDD